MSQGIAPLDAASLDATLLSRVEDAGLNASAPPQQRWIDGWLVRYSPGKAKRARCINALAEGRLPAAHRLSICEDLYRACHLPLLVRVTPFSRPSDLDGWLAQMGFEAFDPTLVMLNRLLPIRPPAALAGLRYQDVDSEAYAHIVGELRGTPLAGQEAHAQRLRASPVPYRGSVLWNEHGQALSCAQMAIEGDRVGLYDVHTATAARGQGLAAWLCLHLLHCAARQGARVAYLQVDASAAAIRLYQRLGFTEGYRYHYRARLAPVG